MVERKLIFLAVGISLFLLIAGGTIGVAISRSDLFKEKEEVRELQFAVDKETIMKGDTVNITVTNVPKDANVTWMLDDGEVKFGQKCCHCFDISKTNHIIAEARWDGGHGNGTIDLCALVEDYHDERSGDKVRDLRRGWGTGSWIEAPFYYCEMGSPKIHGSVTLTDAVGRIEIWIWVYNGEVDFFFSESYPYLATYETINFDQTYEDWDLPETSEEFIFEIDFIVWEGRIGSYDFSIDVDYPGNDPAVK